MAKRVFFSFHYKDVADFRANVVRNHWVTKESSEDAGFFDASIWESAKTISDAKVKSLINDSLNLTSNTCVLIGSETYQRDWVKYEIFKSLDVGNHLFGVHINSIEAKDGNIKPLGSNPLYWLGVKYEFGAFSTYEYSNSGQWWPFDKICRITFKHPEVDIHIDKIYRLSDLFPCYNWITDKGYYNFIDWVK